HPLNPRLGGLTDNGGAALTFALLPGSPALDAGNNFAVFSAGLTSDQRGNPRIVHGSVDIGAFENQMSVSARFFTATEGTPFSIRVAKFDDSDYSAPFDSLIATIDW